MKRIFYSIIAATTCLFSSCLNNDFLDYSPKVSQVPETAFTTYDNFKTYAWGLYGSYFVGGTYDTSLGGNTLSYPSNPPYDVNNDEVLFSSGGRTGWAWQTVTKTTGGGWDFSFIRQVNVMLDHIDNSTMNQADKDHWQSVGRFFRAMRYMDLLANFGDVPWVEHDVKTTDADILYGTRTPRAEVAQHILDDLTFAEQHIKADGEGKGTNSINVDIVRALLSRFGLYEGTYRKYWKLPDYDKFLDICITMSEKVMQANPQIHSNYDALYNSESLSGVKGVLLYSAFATGQMYHNYSRYERTSSANIEMSKSGVDAYLTTNGLPVTNASNQVSKGGQYYGDGDMFNQFRNRDRRLLYTVAPPFRVSGTPGATVLNVPYLKVGDKYGAASKVVTYADSVKFCENIELMKTITSTARTTGYQYPVGITYTSLLPIRNWEGNALHGVPHMNSYQEGRGFLVSRGGFFMYKYYNTSVNPTAQTSTNDLPLFRVEETMLNYAEAKWEKGQFTQAIADMTINKLRVRAGVAAMVVANIDASFDPARDKGGYVASGDPNPIADYEVAPVLWEIRRERHVELMGDKFRFNDLKRWRKGHYFNIEQLGTTVDNADYNNTLAIYPYDLNQGAKTAASNGKVGPIRLAGNPVGEGKGWKWYYYLYPVPPTEIALNPNLTQNPGWDQD